MSMSKLYFGTIVKKCKICTKKTPFVFNIDFKPVPICDDCAKSISNQQISYMFEEENVKC